jgi:RNA polymerase sigma-70 factor (ECF subfamily)
MLRHAMSRRLRRHALGRRGLERLGRERAEAGGFETSPPDLPDEALTRALTTLPAAQREVIALKIDGGLTFAEIAAVIGTSANTAASRYRYALEKLRAALATNEVPR